MAFSEKERNFHTRDGGVTSAMMQQALSQIPPTNKTNTTGSQLHDLQPSLTSTFVGKDVLHSTGPIEDSLNEEPEVDFHGFPTDQNKSGTGSAGYSEDTRRHFVKEKYSGSFTSSEDPRSPKSSSDYSGELGIYDEKNKPEPVPGINPHAPSTHSTGPLGIAGVSLSQDSAFVKTDRQALLSIQKSKQEKRSNATKEKEKERKGLQRGAGVRRKKRARASGGGAKAARVPADKEFAPGLSGPLTTLLRNGGRNLNPLQMQKLVDATTALQQMQVHILEPLTLYTAAELYDLMASMTETWKNSGKAAWKKRINKIRENSRGRKPPRNKLDEGEIAEIMQLEKQIKEREEWEQREKQKMLKERAKADAQELGKRKKRDDSAAKKKRKKTSGTISAAKSP